MKLARVLDVLRGLAPERLAEPWDKVGLHAGDPGQTVRRGLLCIDLTPPVLAEAIHLKANLIVAYHPPIFEPVTSLAETDSPDEWKQRLLAEAVRRRVAIYSPHTALDAAAGGVNDWLCDGLLGKDGEAGRRPITSAESAGKSIKLVTFVPPAHADRLRAALARAGTGRIGGYAECSFSVAGEGTFHGGGTTNPAVGRRGRLERIAELRLEMVLPAARLADVVAALRTTHPYEEPAFDLYPLVSEPAASREGQGRVLALHRPVTLRELAARVKRRLGVRTIEIASPGGLDFKVTRLGLCAGAGGSLLGKAGQIDLFVTGEMRHHDVLDAAQRGIAVILAGHTQTERPYLPAYCQRIMRAGAGVVAWNVSKADRDLRRVF